MTEAEKEHIAKKTKFVQLTRSFWAPELKAQHDAAEEKKAAEAKANAEVKSENRVASQLSSVKGSAANNDKEDDEDESPPYTALVPEHWLTFCRELGELHVLKYQKII